MWIIESINALLSEPIIERQRHLTHIFFLEHVLIPHDELYHAELVCEREVCQESKIGSLGALIGFVLRFRTGVVLRRDIATQPLRIYPTAFTGQKTSRLVHGFR